MAAGSRRRSPYLREAPPPLPPPRLCQCPAWQAAGQVTARRGGRKQAKRGEDTSAAPAHVRPHLPLSGWGSGSNQATTHPPTNHQTTNQPPRHHHTVKHRQQHSTAQSTAQHSTAQHAVQRSTTQHSTQYSATQHSTAPHEQNSSQSRASTHGLTGKRINPKNQNPKPQTQKTLNPYNPHSPNQFASPRARRKAHQIIGLTGKREWLVG